MSEAEKEEGRALLPVPNELAKRLKRIAKKKGFMAWTEYARAKLIEACEKDEEEALKG